MIEDNKFIFALGALLLVILILDFTSSFFIKISLLIIINEIAYIGSLLYCIYVVLMDYFDDKFLVLNIIVVYILAIVFIFFIWFLFHINLCSNPPCYFR